MTRLVGRAATLGLICILAGTLFAQQKPEDIPDAPSAARPIPPPSPRSEAQSEQNGDQNNPAPDDSGHVTSGSKELPRSNPNPAPSTDTTPPPPMPPVRTVPAGSVPKDSETGTDLYTFTSTTTRS